MRRDRRRAWSVYATDGSWLRDVYSTTAAIRATLPNAILDEATGTIRIVPAPDLGLAIRPPDHLRSTDHDAE